jgi:hypothetical protein
MNTMPSAMVAAKKIPIAVSSRICARSLAQAIPHAVARQKATADRTGLTPSRNPKATPPKLAWAMPAPMNARPRSTTYTPITAVTVPIRIEATIARCMKL